MQYIHSTLAVALLMTAAVAGAQPADSDLAMPAQLRTAAQLQLKTAEFTFVRLSYTGLRQAGAWRTDWPTADSSFTGFVASRTGLATRDPVVLDPSDPALTRYPFAYLVEGGQMNLSAAELGGLRRYLSGGGFLLADDCWGEQEWAQLASQIQRVFPDRPIVDIPTSHPIFSSFYRFDGIPTVPGPEIAMGTARAETANPHVRGVFGADGRLMVVLLHNLDLGEAWELAAAEHYPKRYSLGAGVPFGINIVVHALSR